MARLFSTGFETGGWENNGALSAGALGAPTIVSTYKRTGTYSVRINTSGSGQFFRQVFDDDETMLYGRIALYVDSTSSQRNVRMIQFRDDLNNIQFSLRHDAGTQTLWWYDGAPALLAVGNVLIPSDTWVVIEFEVDVGVSGSLTLKVNGTTDAVFSGDTDYTGRGVVRSMYFSGGNIEGALGTGYIYMDDIAINDDSGSYQNSWVGLGGLFYLEPVADGYQNDWTPSTGSDNYAMVDDIPADNATTYNQAVTSGDIDSYEIDDCPTYINTINLVQVCYRAALATSGYNELTDQIYIAGTAYDGLEYVIVPITPAFTYYLGTAWYTNPNSSGGTVAWGTADVNGMEAGIRVTN